MTQVITQAAALAAALASESWTDMEARQALERATMMRRLMRAAMRSGEAPEVGGPAAQMRVILEEVAAAHGLSVARILGYDRQSEVVRARHTAMARAARAGICNAVIAREMQRNHTTIRHGIQNAEAQGWA